MDNLPLLQGKVISSPNPFSCWHIENCSICVGQWLCLTEQAVCRTSFPNIHDFIARLKILYSISVQTQQFHNEGIVGESQLSLTHGVHCFNLSLQENTLKKINLKKKFKNPQKKLPKALNLKTRIILIPPLPPEE